MAASGWAGVSLDEFPNLKAWEDRMLKRPGVAKGQDVPEPNKLREKAKDPGAAEEEAAKARKWILEGQNKDAK